MTPYDKLLKRKRKWSPVQTTAGKLQDGAEETLFRALAMRHMEVPVGDFIQEALKGEVPETAREILVSNIRDEERHDLALGYIAEAHGVDEKAEQEALKEKEVKEAKSKAELEKLMQQRIAEKDTEILKYKSEIKKIIQRIKICTHPIPLNHIIRTLYFPFLRFN